MKKVLCILFTLLGSFLWADIRVESVGWGKNLSEARGDALRQAVEKAVGVKVFSQTVVRDFVALRDILISKSFGFVTSYEVLEKEKLEKGVWQVRLRAKVSKDVREKWDRVEVVLEQKGHPRIMLFTREYVDGRKVFSGEYALLKKWKNIGMRLVDYQASFDQELLKKHEGTKDKMVSSQLLRAAAKKGASLLVVGNWRGYFHSEVEGPGGISFFVYTYHLQTKIYRPDSQQVVSATSQTYRINLPAALHSRNLAGESGLSKVVEKEYAEKISSDLLQFWVQDIQEGTRMDIGVQNIDYEESELILEIFRQQPEIFSDITVDSYENEELKISLKSKVSSTNLASRLLKTENFSFQVMQLQKNTLTIKFLAFLRK